MPKKCLTCGGVFDPVQADGTSYFHVCPPNVDKITSATAPRANARDENVDQDKRAALGEHATRDQVCKAPGLGVVDV